MQASETLRRSLPLREHLRQRAVPSWSLQCVLQADNVIDPAFICRDRFTVKTIPCSFFLFCFPRRPGEREEETSEYIGNRRRGAQTSVLQKCSCMSEPRGGRAERPVSGRWGWLHEVTCYITTWKEANHIWVLFQLNRFLLISTQINLALCYFAWLNISRAFLISLF